MQQRIEELLEARVNTGWIAGTTKCDWTLTGDNQIVDASERYVKEFTFMGITGWIDRYDYVGWGNMGFGLEAAGLPLAIAIWKQTGICKHPGLALMRINTVVETVRGAAQGDWDENCDGTKNKTKPGERGKITYIDSPECIGVVFHPSGCCVNLEVEELLDPKQYRLYLV